MPRMTPNGRGEESRSTSLPVLTFHSIEDTPSIISFAPQVFSRGLATLHEHGYQSLDMLEAMQRLSLGHAVPDHAVVLTFDDGYKSVYDEAFPILQRYGMSATIFLTVGTDRAPKASHRLPTLCGRPMLSWGEIREMARSGMRFGAHTLTHPDLTKSTPERIEAEIVESQAIIEDMLGMPVPCFAYPFGRYNRSIETMVKHYFSCACTDMLGVLGARSDPFAIDRVDAYFVRTDRLFQLLLTALFPWYVLGWRTLRRARRAVARR